MVAPKIYLAGPDVFFPNPEQIGKEMKNLCAKHGLEGVFPLDDADLSGHPGIDTPTLGLKISKANENLICDSDGIVANINPFRGPSADPGTVYEIGFGKALGKVIVGYTINPLHFADRTRKWVREQGKELCGDRDHEGLLIENFGLVDNLMIDGGIKSSGGTILKTFEEAVIWMKNYFNKN